MRTFFSVLIGMLWAWVIFLTAMVFMFWDLSFVTPRLVWFVMRVVIVSSVLIAFGVALIDD